MEREKHTAESIMALVRQLSGTERAKLQHMLNGSQGNASDLEAYLTKQRFAAGRFCPICGGAHVVRNGRRKSGAQKFICKDCGKTFSISKNTVFSGTHKALSVWMEYLNCMAEGLSLDKSAERCGITHSTAFTWRHKILDTIGKDAERDNLTGIVEADEAFLAVSYKGDPKAECKERPSRKRGGEVHQRGLSEQLVCIPCAIDRKGNALSKVAKLGKCSSEAVKLVLGGHIPQEATLCTDKDAAYRRFSRDNGNMLVQIKGGKGTVKGIYHIQHLNAYHTGLKDFLRRFKGVSTKYLNNYLTWNNTTVHRAKSLTQRVSALLERTMAVLFEETCRQLPNRPPVPVLVKNQS